MTEEACGLYERLAEETGGKVVPVALAWEDVLKRDPGCRLHAAEGYHPSPAGI